MAKQEGAGKSTTRTSAKKEALAAYEQTVKDVGEKREAQMRPAEKAEEKAEKQAIQAADVLSIEGIAKAIGTLKSEVGVMLAQVSDKLEAELTRYLQIKKAAAVREKELAEIYEIERSASSLTALIEVQQAKREQFEQDMAEEKSRLEAEIETARREWERESAEHEAAVKEQEAAEKKKRDRETEDFKYRFEREQQLAREQFEYQKAKLDREIQFKREEMEKDLLLREKALAQQETELKRLREREQAFPKELEAAVASAVKEGLDRAGREAKAREELLAKQAQGEQNVLNSRIAALQETVKGQAEQIARLSAQLEKSYSQVQDIAVKAIQGSSNLKLITPMPAPAADQPRRSSDAG